jgi:hypothetical protein
MRRGYKKFWILVLLTFCFGMFQNFTPFRGLNWQKQLGINNLIPLSDQEMGLIPKKLNGDDVQKMIPLNLTPGSTESTLAQEIAKHSAYAFANYDQFGDLGTAAQKMEKSLTVGAGSGDGKESDSKWNVQLMNTRSETQLRYKGDIDLKCNYSYSNQSAEMELKPSKAGSTSIVIERQMKDDSSSVKMKWNW